MVNDGDKMQRKDMDSPASIKRYEEWRTFQGREDAEMLQEKSRGWSAGQKDSDSWGED